MFIRLTHDRRRSTKRIIIIPMKPLTFLFRYMIIIWKKLPLRVKCCEKQKKLTKMCSFSARSCVEKEESPHEQNLYFVTCTSTFLCRYIKRRRSIKKEKTKNEDPSMAREHHKRDTNKLYFHWCCLCLTTVVVYSTEIDLSISLCVSLWLLLSLSFQSFDYFWSAFLQLYVSLNLDGDVTAIQTKYERSTT